MSAPIVSRWPVLLVAAVDAGDVDADGHLTEAAVERLFAVARDAYFDLCPAVDRSAVEIRELSIRIGPTAVGDEVSISAGVTEIFSDRFVVAGRVRATGGDGVAADVSCSMSAGEVSAAMRDGFISLAHNASHMH